MDVYVVVGTAPPIPQAPDRSGKMRSASPAIYGTEKLARFALAISAVTLRHMPTTPPDYASQHFRMRSIRKVLFASFSWPCAMTDAIPGTSGISCGATSTGPARGTARASTIIVAYRSARGLASFHNNSSRLIKLFYYLLICCADFCYTPLRLLNDTPSDADRLTISE
jgi:hypothetical protein